MLSRAARISSTVQMVRSCVDFLGLSTGTGLLTRMPHSTAPKTYESNLSTIQNLIIPYVGSMEMQKLKPYHMENLYTTLSKTPCGSYIEGKKQELTEKQKQLFLSGTTIHEVHRLLGTAFQYAHLCLLHCLGSQSMRNSATVTEDGIRNVPAASSCSICFFRFVASSLVGKLSHLSQLLPCSSS